MDKYSWAAFHFAEAASDAEWMCLAWLYLDNFHVDLALWMANQRRCPEAVALALYWYSHPYVCADYRKRGQISRCHSVRYAVFETVERYFDTGFYSVSELGFNPARDISESVGPLSFPLNWLDSLPEGDSKGSPRLRQAIPGVTVNARRLIDEWREGLPPRIAEQVFDLKE
ncbi:hypothetical protein GO986_06900 [Deinococcus sp. HMF7620]|uniref:DUF4274 domain-containing protein n=1 Tax=Deinococcus arboris TaxID=2682977 RepID=A0A7C9I2F5_9DEIO|nr:hypothetical protein [Deinococcus arboris]MVN86491.1 hypothetical protein [Deinococcus arboris]